MIFGNTEFLKRYSFLDSKVLQCFEYAAKNDLSSFEKGTHKIDADNIFVNIVEYETTTKEQRFWEAHKKYIDIHLMLTGTERIDINFIDNMTKKDYIEKDDFLPLEGEANSNVILTPKDFTIFYPEDGHMTALYTKSPEKIKKAIFKVII